MKRLLLCLTFFGVCLLTAGKVSGAIRYVAANGSDSNNGITKTTPWLHAPGMTGCSANCASYTPQPGDQFILRGGDTWHFATGTISLPWRWQVAWSGTAANRIYIGVDQTFFTGAAWTRPVLTGDNPPSNSNVSSCVKSLTFGDINSNTTFLMSLRGNFVTLDNLEFTGVCWDGVGGSGGTRPSQLLVGASNLILDHLYFHGHSKTAAAQVTDLFAMSGDSGVPAAVNTELRNSVFDMSDGMNGLANALDGPADFIHHNYFTKLCDVLLGGVKEFHDNIEDTIAPPDPQLQAHCNPLNVVTSNSGGTSIYNNIFRHIITTSGQQCTNPSNGGIDKWYNNVFWDDALGGVCVTTDTAVNPGISGAVIYNNTLEGFPSGGVPSGACIGIGRGGGVPFGSMVIRNNYCKSDNNGVFAGDTQGVFFNSPQPETIESNNILRTNAQAASDGYTTVQQFVLSPFGAINQVTVGGGLNLTASCSGPLTALCSDTTYGGITYDAVNHKVVLPGRITNSRPASGAWDVGAYQFAGAQAPAPPTNVTATVQ